MSDDRELIWVNKEFAEKWKKLNEEKTTRDQQEIVFNQYMESVKVAVKRDFEANLETLEEDAAIFTGLMLKTKQAFEKAKNEQLDASYQLWENFEKDIPSVREKTQKIIDQLKPLSAQAAEINKSLSTIKTYEIDRITESLRAFFNLTGNNKKLFEFIINNFKSKED
jgi:hypothetical protein